MYNKLNKNQIKAIEEHIKYIIVLMERTEDKADKAFANGEDETGNNYMNAVSRIGEELKGIDFMLNALGYCRDYRMGEDWYHPIVTVRKYGQEH